MMGNARTRHRGDRARWGCPSHYVGGLSRDRRKWPGVAKAH